MVWFGRPVDETPAQVVPVLCIHTMIITSVCNSNYVCSPTSYHYVRADVHVDISIALYKIFIHVKAFVHESIILLLPPHPPTMPTLLQYYCNTIAQYTTPPPPPPPFLPQPKNI